MPGVAWCPECSKEYDLDTAQDVGYECTRCLFPLSMASGIIVPQAEVAEAADAFVRSLERKM